MCSTASVPPLSTCCEIDERAELFGEEEEPGFAKTRKSVVIEQGFVTVNVSGYLGPQRIPIEELADVLPVYQIREAAIKVLRQRGVKRMRQNKKKVVKQRCKSRAREEESKAEWEATIFK